MSAFIPFIVMSLPGRPQAAPGTGRPERVEGFDRMGMDNNRTKGELGMKSLEEMIKELPPEFLPMVEDCRSFHFQPRPPKIHFHISPRTGSA
jgi:hypothetical protein